jgi:hypothetical protein
MFAEKLKRMRKEIVHCHSEDEARRTCSWACRVVRVWNGFLCFESEDEFWIWNDQK